MNFQISSTSTPACGHTGLRKYFEEVNRLLESTSVQLDCVPSNCAEDSNLHEEQKYQLSHNHSTATAHAHLGLQRYTQQVESMRNMHINYNDGADGARAHSAADRTGDAVMFKHEPHKSYSRAFQEHVMLAASTSGVLATAEQYQVPASTVRNWMRCLTNTHASSPSRQFSHLAMSEADESTLAERIRQLRKEGVPLTFSDVALQAEALVGSHVFAHAFPSAGWISKFLHRHNLSLHKPYARAPPRSGQPSLPDMIDRFWLECRNKRSQFNIPPERCIALDEVFVRLSYHGHRVVDDKGVKHAYTQTSGHEDEGVSVVLAYLGNGQKLRPLFLFRGTNTLPVDMPAGVPPHLQPVILFCPEGKVREDNYITILKNLDIDHSLRHLLADDIYSAHHTTAVTMVKQALNLEPVTVPAHGTRNLNVGDVGVHAGLKARVGDMYAHEMQMRAASGDTSSLTKSDWRDMTVRFTCVSWMDYPEPVIERTFKRVGTTVALDGSEDGLIDVVDNHVKLFPKRSLWPNVPASPVYKGEAAWSKIRLIQEHTTPSCDTLAELCMSRNSPEALTRLGVRVRTLQLYTIPDNWIRREHSLFDSFALSLWLRNCRPDLFCTDSNDYVSLALRYLQDSWLKARAGLVQQAKIKCVAWLRTGVHCERLDHYEQPVELTIRQFEAGESPANHLSLLCLCEAFRQVLCVVASVEAAEDAINFVDWIGPTAARPGVDEAPMDNLPVVLGHVGDFQMVCLLPVGTMRAYQPPQPARRKRAALVPQQVAPKRSHKAVQQEQAPSDDELQYEVEEILDARHRKGHAPEYLVHWKDYSSDEDCWVTEQDFHDKELLNEFKANNVPSSYTSSAEAVQQRYDLRKRQRQPHEE